MLALLSAALPRYQHTAAHRFLARDAGRDVCRLVVCFLRHEPRPIARFGGLRV
jgi:hypothetical protein